MSATTIETLRCDSCHAPIVWTITEGGNRMPCDAEPVPGGNVRIIPAGNGRPAQARITPNGMIDLFDPDDDGVRHVSHFATCPDANEWRAS